MNIPNSPQLNLEQIRRLMESGAFDGLIDGTPAANDSAGPDGFDRGPQNDGPFASHKPRRPPLTLGAEADSVAVTALARAIADPALIEAILSGGKGKLIRAVDAAAANAASEFFKTMGVEPQPALTSVLRQTLRRATYEIEKGLDPMAALAKSLEITRNFSDSQIDPASVTQKPAVEYSAPHSLGEKGNVAALQGLAGVLSGGREIVVDGQKGKLSDFLTEAGKAKDQNAYIAAIAAAGRNILEQLEKSGLVPDGEEAAQKTLEALHQMLFATTAWQAKGEDVASAISLAMSDSGHFPLEDLAPETLEPPAVDDPAPADDTEETPDVRSGGRSLGADSDEKVVDSLASVLAGDTTITVGEDSGTFEEMLERAKTSEDSVFRVNVLRAATAAVLGEVADAMPSDAKEVLEIELAVRQLLLTAHAAQAKGESASEALRAALETFGHFSGE